ncbi:protoporphyrinogen oxidase [Asanoa ishikariensis]|uniref:Coproporphyrinogen III oxidase n=1 Tax=Asanoa ishikariensis TaxID=137265 RepID=A0A1H3RRT3_9ACTN|nr:protoporphyrinogen oxidase [Asanoa ishikariensis]GIF66894.1 protoporphyrinogen oxidase [Asanoa ishikariensis]SDZ28484.1 oxygen-dependent protoporphyrinogen oxidase [Asanoa ishikariensis]
MQNRVAVIGGGIAGLAAAVRINDAAPGTAVTIFEQGATLGGKLRTGEVAGSPVELGAEAFLVRDTATGEDSPAIKLARRLGLGDDLVNPAVGAAALAVGGKLVPMPRGTLTGVPGDVGTLAGVAAVEDHDLDAGEPLLAEGEDVSVGALVRRRLGDQVVDRLVDPMLGGVYAGRADRLSLAATMPALARQARRAGTLTGAVKAAQAAFPRVPGGAVFATVRGGVSRLVEAAAEASGAELRLGATVRELTRLPDGTWRLTVGPTRDPEYVTVDAVVLAVPARPAARLLQAIEPDAAREVGALDYASVALVTLALPRLELPELSGFLVPAENGTAVKAATFFSTKWTHQRRSDGVALVRASVGRYGDEHVLQRDDAELVGIVHRELSTLVAHSLPKSLDTKVQRWGGALPQYAPGHLDRVAAARAALRREAPTLALAGAGYDGVGIPICVRSGESAADAVLAALRDRQQAG